MSEPSLKPQPFPENEESVQALSPMLVSCVENALDTETQHYDPKEIIEWIRAGKLRARVEVIRGRFCSVMVQTSNDRKVAKDAVDSEKKRLPGVTWSGTFSRRGKNHLLQHSGFLCADLDALGDQVAEVRTKLSTSPHLWALFASPTGDGLKCVFRVPPDAGSHKASFRAVEEHVRQLTGVQVDQACSDVSRLCFLSYDPDVHLRDDAVELPPLVEPATSTVAVTPPAFEPEIEMRRGIAIELLGKIKWTSKTRGYGICPGQQLHTTGNGERDCEVLLDGAPTIRCFHDSCRATIDSLNGQLRSRIGKAEHAMELPEIVSAEQFLSESLDTPAELAKGMMHQGTLTMLSGGSKSFKTFTLIDLGVSVSHGVSWWGRDVAVGRVLYLNFEISKPFFQKRLFDLSDAKDVTRPLQNFDLWNLRGHAADIKLLMPKIIERCRGEG